VLDAAQRFLWEPTNAHAPLLRELTVSGDGGLDEVRVVEAIGGLPSAELSAMDGAGSKARVALEALREALFFWLLAVGERITPEADDALGRAVRQKLAPIEALAAAAP
jgi:hypothetical protein